ncbi:DeoR/GlpR family DNA-binding transcription regulator [Paenibacillus woosongensis]|uniref:DeoR family transcriptional regulator n=1 Tax=Paenibacillus woosongensis TaxID=307580 RepID=A0A7X2Z167_9BACL|nr:DeoR/GlpR family DNA-binding transcription regulator [Paenibacillus woosongensis]MUG45699.1 DeoR family transcriptional regulator [Paenibacillus woosongensis]
MLAAERRQMMISMVHADKRVLVSELSDKFNVTEETIRRDLEKLEKEGIVTRTYGGAILNSHTNEDLPFTTRNATNSEIKQQIASKALDLIHDGDTLMMDPSSTSYELMKLLHQRKNLTVITSSIHILHEFLNSGIQIISTGGTLRPRSMSLVGTNAEEIVKKYNVDKVVMSCKALFLGKGVMDSNEPECELKKAMLRQASKVLLLADHSKFNKTAFVKLMEFDEIDTLITDREPEPAWMDMLKEKEIEVVF